MAIREMARRELGADLAAMINPLPDDNSGATEDDKSCLF
jgi:hypothetical protein